MQRIVPVAIGRPPWSLRLREHTGRLLVSDEEKNRLLRKLQEKSEAFERQARGNLWHH